MKVYAGDRIKAQGELVTIGKVLFQGYAPAWQGHPEELDVEFLDTDGNYRHWRNWLDGGELIQRPVPMFLVRMEAVRSLCIKEQWYTMGNNDEYEHLLLHLIPDEPCDVDQVMVMAQDIFDHSDVDRIKDSTGYDDDEVLNMMAELILNEAAWITLGGAR